MNKTLVILTISLSSIFTINSVFADSAKLVNPENNHAYKRFDKAKTWTQAKTACASQNGYLVTVTSQIENDWIWNNFGVSPAKYGDFIGFWIGGSKANGTNGAWTWVTNEIWNYSNWDKFQPDFLSTQHKLAMWNGYYADSAKGSWDNGDSTFSASYLCEWDKPLKNYTNMTTADTNNDSVSEFVLIGNNGSVNKVVSIDRQTKTVISEVDFSAYPTYNGVSLSIVDDMNNNGKAEFSLLLTKKSDGSSVIETRDSGTGELLESYVVPR